MSQQDQSSAHIAHTVHHATEQFATLHLHDARSWLLQDNPDMEEEITPAVVACGSEYTASITRRGQLLTWGLGSRGELGHGPHTAGEVGLAASTLQ